MQAFFFILILTVSAAFAQNGSAPQRASTGAAVVDTSSMNPIDSIPVSDTIGIPVLDFKNTDIRDVLRALGMQYNVNIYLEPEVTGSVSLYLTDVPVKSAIDFIVKRRGYSYVVENGIVKVFKYNPPAPPPPPEPPVHFNVNNGHLSCDFRDVSAREVARLFSDSARINVVIEGTQNKKITSHLNALEPEKALKVIYESNGYDVVNNDGVYYVAAANWGGKESEGMDTRSLRRLSINVSPSKKISMEVDNAALDQVVRSIAVQSGINIFIYDKLTGSITAKVDSVRLDDALRFLLQNTQFNFWKDRGIYFIGSKEMSQQKTTLVLPLKHIMAEEENVGKLLPPAISRDAVIKYDNEHNSVIVIGSFDVAARAQEFIEKIDRPVPQVLIEALVVDFNINKIRQFGLSVFTGGSKDENPYSESFVPEVNLKPGREKTQRILNHVLSMIGVNEVIKLPQNFKSSIHALEIANVVKVHSTPQIATLNGNSASITIGETRYYRLTKETKAPINDDGRIIGTDERFEVIKFNTQLEVTPWVMDDGYVMVKIRPEFNIPRTGGDGNTPPNVDTRVLESMVRLRNGQTIVLGGQRQTENGVDGRGVPILSSIPLLGWLFSNKTFKKTETQMMIFLTPHVYYGDENAVTPDDFFGDELNRMLEKHEPKKFGERRENRRERRKQAQAGEDSLESTIVVQEKKEKDDKGFRWPWQREPEKKVLVKDENGAKSSDGEKETKEGRREVEKKAVEVKREN